MVERGEAAEEEVDRQHRTDYLLLKRKLIVSAVLTVMILVGSMTPLLSFLPFGAPVWLFVLTTPVQFWVGGQFLSKRLGQGTARFQRYEYSDRGWDLGSLSLQYGGGVCSRFFYGSRTAAPGVFRYGRGDYYPDPAGPFAGSTSEEKND